MAGALVVAVQVCCEEWGLCPLAAEESALLCSSEFMGAVGAGASPDVRICETKLLLMQKDLLATALQVLRKGDSRRQSQRLFLMFPSVSPGQYTLMSEASEFLLYSGRTE